MMRTRNQTHLGWLQALSLAVLFCGPLSAFQIEGTDWFPIGPAPIDGFFPGGVTGRASAIAVNSANPDDIWLGTAAGGVWHSVDGGETWTPMSDKERFSAIGAIALDGCDAQGCDRIYAGTGENAIRRDTYYGGGLMIGQVFTSDPEFPQFGWILRTGDPFQFGLGSINDVVLDPSTSGSTKRIFITLSSGLTVSATEASVTAPEPAPGGYGLYRSNDDGMTWSQLSVPGSAGARPSDLEMDPTDNNVLFAGFLTRGVFQSTDNGTTWCPLNEGIAIPPGCPDASGLPNVNSTEFDQVEIAPAPGDPQTIYVSFGHCEDRLIQNCVPSIYRSLDGGMTWAERFAGVASDGNALGILRTYSRYTHGFAVHPDDPDLVLLGGIKLWRSINGAQSFTASDATTAPGSSPWGPIIHLDHREILVHPNVPSRMYVSNDGGFATSVNSGTSWTPRNNDLQITGFHSISSSPNTSVVLGASQDNGGVLWSGSRNWDHQPCCGDGGFTAIDLDNPMILYALSNFGSVMRSTNGGMNWGNFMSGIDVNVPRLFYAPFVQDPSEPHPLYWGGDQLFRSGNDAASWQAVSPVLATGDQPEIVTGANSSDHISNGGVNVITAIAVAPSDPDRVYVGYYGGEAFVTDGACTNPACWSSIGADVPDFPITRIAVDSEDPDVAYATLSGFGSHARVWKTSNGGTSWNAVVNGLPTGIPANTITVEPSFPDRLWLGLDSGPNGASLYKSTDGGSNWQAFSLGLPNAPVFEISIDENRGLVYSATHGRGAFVLGEPAVNNFEGWVGDSIWDIPVYGQNFLANQSCTMQILQSDGTPCATSSVDAMGGNIETDATGVLVTSNASFYGGKPVAWACFNGNCLDNTPIAECNDDANGDAVPDPLTTVLIDCGGQLGVANVKGCPLIANPPSTLLGLGTTGPGTAHAGSFDLTAIIQRRVRPDSLCSVRVGFGVRDTYLDIFNRARDALNASASCTAAGILAEIDMNIGGAEEDDFSRSARLFLQGSSLEGAQLITGVHVAPGELSGVRFNVDRLGIPVLAQTQVVKISLETVAGGAAGGDLTVIQRSGLGTCAIMVPTVQGQSAQEIAQNVEDAFQAPGIPGPHPDCPSTRNQRDLTAQGNSIISVFAIQLEMSTTDSGLGFSFGSQGLDNVHPIAEAGPDQARFTNSNDPAGVALDGRLSSDPDSTPGTDDDIVAYRWFEELGGGGRVMIASGSQVTVSLSPGNHRIVLEVEDSGGLTDEDALQVQIVPDCNGNRIDDAQDIASGASQDINGNGRPDECEINSITWILIGTAQGGTVEITIDGFTDSCTVAVATNPGDSAQDVVASLAAAINADACSNSQGIEAQVNGNGLVIIGFEIREGGTNIQDPGLSHQFAAIPLLSPGGLALLVLLLTIAGLIALRLVGAPS